MAAGIARTFDQEGDVLARLDSFLRLVVEQHASDLHFHAGVTPLIRHDGELVPLNFRALSDTDTQRFLLEILTPEQRERFEREQEIDFIYELPDIGRFRANMFRQARGIGSVFRIVPNRLPTIEELYLPRVVKKLTELQNGLVLVTGPTGSGKTTTMAALIHETSPAGAHRSRLEEALSPAPTGAPRKARRGIDLRHP